MAVRIFRSVWFLSTLAVLACLLYQYASWPEQVVIGQEEVNFITLSRDGYFYLVLAVLTLINVTVYIAKRFTKRAEGLMAWFYGFIGVINFFLIIAISFISLFNSNESFRFGQIGFIIYGSMFLVGAWLVGGLIYYFIQKRTAV